LDLVRLAWSRLRHDGRRSLATFLAVAIAVTSFIVLAASTYTQQLRLSETVDQNFRAAYDILVRPAGSSLGLEKSEGLVRPNYLSGTYGGLTLDQLAAIRAVEGVEVAAPIAMVGYYYQVLPITIDAADLLQGDGRSLLRWSGTISARNATATAPGPSGYLYRTNNLLVYPGEQTIPLGTTVLPGVTETVDGQDRHPCPWPVSGHGPESPFDPAGLWEGGRCSSTQETHDQSMFEQVTVRVAYPMLVAAIDPEAEAALVGLDSAITEGRYLTGQDTYSRQDVKEGDSPGQADVVPALLAISQDVDYQTRIRIESLPQQVIDQLGRTVDDDLNRTLIERATPTATVSDTVVDAASLYKDAIASRSVDDPWYSGAISMGSDQLRTTMLWRPSDVTYQAGATLQPVVVGIDTDQWRSRNISANNGFEVLPFTTQDTNYRTMTSYSVGRSDASGSEGDFLHFDMVGKFDPAAIDEFSKLSAVPLETYTSPEVIGADDASRAALGDQPMRSDLNLGGYLQQAPSLLIPIAGLSMFSPDRLFKYDNAAPLSAVRVRVGDITGLDQNSRTRIEQVATDIEAATGADVDITIGSSPEQLQVALPATTLGSPAITLTEPWTRKGIAYRLIGAIDAKSFLLFGLILLSAGLTVAISAGAGVQHRRRELGILAALGWTSTRRTTSLLTELGILGCAAGIVGALASWPLSVAAGADFDWLRAVVAIPVAIALTTVAGSVAAVRAGRLQPVEAIKPPELGGGRRLFRVRGGLTLGLQRILRRPGRLLLAATALGLATASLILLTGLVQSFRGQVIGTLLGDTIAIQVRPQDLVAAVFLAILGITATVMVLYMNITEDARTYATLQAAGWGRARLTTSITSQAAIIGLAGTTLGLIGGLSVTGWLTGTLPHPVLTDAANIAIGGIAAAVLASLVPAASLRRIPTARILATE